MKSDTDRHHYYPLFLDVKGKECLIAGGGSVAERKALMLLKFNASVTVVSPRVTKKLAHLADTGVIRVHTRKYRRGDLDKAAVVFACTNDRETNAAVREDAALRGVLVNVVDKPEECDFIVPSIIRKGDVTIAISTSGVLPMASKKIRQAIEKTVTKDYVAYTRIIGALRRHLIDTIPDPRRRRAIMKDIGAMDIRDVVKRGLKGMKKVLGEGIA
ncbi:MAG: bifunctional precorrin-2 dehydrogenase/sirohydrochlorin ferrochelatase [Syntrophorhabdaceae bacterium]|nr:bifunctional precorrin-2 dehydrogenase/sirohydrochlorin ferrochelatase [Syntrophorhabdaceae bacterium]